MDFTCLERVIETYDYYMISFVILIMLDATSVDEVNAWANVLQALGQVGHDNAYENQKVLREITIIVKEQLKLLASKSE